MRKFNLKNNVYKMLLITLVLMFVLSCKGIPLHCPEFSIKKISSSHRMFATTFFDEYGTVEICTHYQFCQKIPPRIHIPQLGSFQGEYLPLGEFAKHETCFRFVWDDTNFHQVIINWNEASFELAQPVENWKH